MPFLAVLLMAACGDNPANDDSAPDLTWRPVAPCARTEPTSTGS